MFAPIVRFSVDGSVAAVKSSGVRSTRRTSSYRVTSHSCTAGTQLDRFLVAQPGVERIGIALQLLKRDRLADRQRPLPPGREDGVFWARTITGRKATGASYRPPIIRALSDEEGRWTSKASGSGSSTRTSTAWSAASTCTARRRPAGSRRSASASTRSRTTRRSSRSRGRSSTWGCTTSKPRSIATRSATAGRRTRSSGSPTSSSTGEPAPWDSRHVLRQAVEPWRRDGARTADRVRAGVLPAGARRRWSGDPCRPVAPRLRHRHVGRPDRA